MALSRRLHTNLLRKDSFVWSEEATKVFQDLKVAMITVPVLALLDFSKPFVMESDASEVGLGALLMQGKQPIAYYNHTLSRKDRLKSVYERELIAIVLSVQKWRPYLLGWEFIVPMDQRSLKYLLEQHEVAEEHQKWMHKLLRYKISIEYKAGAENRALNALFRKENEFQAAIISLPAWGNRKKLFEEITEDLILKQFRSDVKEGKFSWRGYSLEGDMLFYEGKMVISKGSLYISVLSKQFHESPIGSNSKRLKTYQWLRREIYLAVMLSDVEKWVAECDVC